MPKSNVRRGNGGVYQQPGSSIWWMHCSVNGRLHRESTGTADKREAIAFLDLRRAQISLGTFSIESNRVTVGHLLDNYLATAKLMDLKSIADIEGRIRLHLRPAFGHLKATDVTTTVLKRHVESRLKSRTKPATINREIEMLKRAFNLGAQHDPPLVLRVPHFTKLKENNIRKGFLELPEYEKLLVQCVKEGLWMSGIFETGYTFGWRAEEVVKLQASQVDLANECIRLNPGETKNDAGRIAYMTPALHASLLPLMAGKSGSDRVFIREDGSPADDFRKAWWRACVAAGLGKLQCRSCKSPSDSASSCKACQSDNVGYQGLLFHDLRRTAVRNMVRRGVPEKWAMAISGHKTRAIFDRYAIVSDTDLKDVARRMEEGRVREVAALRDKESHENFHSSFIAAPNKVQSKKRSLRHK